MTSVPLPPEAQTNEAGEIALRHHPISNSRIFVSGLKSGNQYVATVQANICMVWVKPEDLQQVLKKKGGCCNKNRKLFNYANENDVRQWTARGGS